MKSTYIALLAVLFLGASAIQADTSRLSCNSSCTCKGNDGSSTIALTSSGNSEADAKKDAQGQCDYFASLAGAAPGVCTVTDFICH